MKEPNKSFITGGQPLLFLKVSTYNGEKDMEIAITS